MTATRWTALLELIYLNNSATDGQARTSLLHPNPMISLTFDDALHEHLDHAVPILDGHGLLGTFYTHLAAPAFAARLDEWRLAARRGHELGNHTIFHPADARKKWVRQGNAIDHYSLDRMQLELETANRFLQALDGRSERTFAYPCSNPILGRRGLVKSLLFKAGWEFTRLPGMVDRFHLDIGSTRQSYAPVVRELFIAARGGGLTLQSPAPPPLQTWDRHMLPSAAVEDWTFHDLVGDVQRGLQAESWVILQFHGVGGGHHMNCDLAVFRDFAAWLSDHHADRVVTIAEGVRKTWLRQSGRAAQQRRKAQLHA